MSFAKLKAARQDKPSYVTSNALPSQESSAVPSEGAKESLYKSIPDHLQIRTSAVSGRGLWITKPCLPGQVLFAVKPHVAALSNERLALHCSQCFGGGGNAGLKRCTQCQLIYYCDSTCQNLDWTFHKNECIALQRVTASGETAIPSDAIRCLGRIMWKRQKQGPASPWTQEIDLLQSHKQEVQPSAYELHTHIAISLVRYLGLSSPSEIAAFGIASGADLADFVSRFVTNTFTITDPSLAPLGASVSPPVALINHSCDPNAVVVFPRSRPNNQEPLMQVVALREISANEEILTAYIDTTLPKAQRQTSLRETYLFSCACALCMSTQSDLRDSVWCPKACGGVCPAPTEGKFTRLPRSCTYPHNGTENSLSRCTQCLSALQKTDEVLDALRIGQQALDKASLLQSTDPAKSKQLCSKLIPILTSAGFTPSSHPLLALTRLYTALLIADLQSSSPSQETLDDAVVCATKAVAGLDGILRYGHPVRGIARAELGKLLAVDEPAPRPPAASAAEEALRYPPSGAKRLRMALDVLLQARGELGVGFGAPNEGGAVGRDVREDVVRLERELGVWQKGLSEAMRDANEAKTVQRS
ncbi:histone-lysine N-methyltransferase ASHR1 [Favolaschia claudopus]|uniref:Histone-lysine N-methyltransferase ASHR1 n=1 Tax=Favolaschia claudopus TaxID=2862362 RepID=A0AAV9Z699_9AGAR